MFVRALILVAFLIPAVASPTLVKDGEEAHQRIRREYCASVSVFPLGNTGRGSGTLVRRGDKVFILTAAHLFTDDSDKVIEMPATIEGACIPDLTANLAAIDVEKDLAALKIMDEVKLGWKIGVEIGDQPLLGEKVVVIGSPGINGRAWHHNVTSGVASSIGIVEGVEVVKIDAAIWFGNSGGGVFNEQHQLIGVVSRLSVHPVFGVVPGGFYAISPNEIASFLASAGRGRLLP